MSEIEELEARLREARAAAEAYADLITGKYAGLMPRPEGETGLVDPELLVERARAWTDEERAELERLRKAATDAALQLHRARQRAGNEPSGD